MTVSDREFRLMVRNSYMLRAKYAHESSKPFTHTQHKKLIELHSQIMEVERKILIDLEKFTELEQQELPFQ